MREEEKQKLDEKRKELLFQVRELSDLMYWLENGYKECDGRKIATDLIQQEIDSKKKIAEYLFNEIFSPLQGDNK